MATEGMIYISLSLSLSGMVKFIHWLGHFRSQGVVAFAGRTEPRIAKTKMYDHIFPLRPHKITPTASFCSLRRSQRFPSLLFPIPLIHSIYFCYVRLPFFLFFSFWYCYCNVFDAFDLIKLSYSFVWVLSLFSLKLPNRAPGIILRC